ncbi:hypothetical protein HYALB_00000248 [Hymenoscyphus albidus]|uniref:Uncharacterized protein n=1 Tax=Hymenoscyphus albidus TaxID=595503 RepID=A0A9N9LPS5_9HELO|nr:hypothetical protein HYALB_00000248 [Hymenoscyphus albidus]
MTIRRDKVEAGGGIHRIGGECERKKENKLGTPQSIVDTRVDSKGGISISVNNTSDLVALSAGGQVIGTLRLRADLPGAWGTTLSSFCESRAV